MGYEIALDKAWRELEPLCPERRLSVRFMAEEYAVDLRGRLVLTASCNALSKDFVSVLILHYLIRKVKGLPPITGEWCDFKELAAVEGYYSAFRGRAIEPVIRKYGNHPDAILSVLERLPGRRVAQGDIGICLDAFDNVPALILLWRPDEEFGPEANILFDRNITRIFCTEDIVVLAGFIAASV